MPEAPPKKINSDSFKRGLSLEEKVESNSKKITLIKNTINLRKENVNLRLEGIEDDVENTNNDLMDGLHSITESLVGVKAILADQVKERIRQRKADRKENERLKKKRREDELENKKEKGEGPLKSVGGVAKDIFGRLKKFLTNILLGATLINLLDWLKDPKNLDSLKNFAQFLQDHGLKIIATLAALAAINFIGGLFGIGGALKAILGLVGVKAFAIAAAVVGTGIALKVVSDWLIGKQIGGGKVITEGRRRVREQYKKEVIKSNEELMENSPDTPLLDANLGYLVYPKGHPKEGALIKTLNYLGNDGWKGPANAFEDPTGKSTGTPKLIAPGTFKADGSTWGTLEQINLVFKKEKALDEIGEPGKGIQKEMWDKIRKERKEVWKEIRDERANSQELKNIRSLPRGADRTFRLKEYENETLRMKKEAQNAAEERIKKEYTGKLGKLVDEAFTGPTLTEKEMYDYWRSKPNEGFPRIEKYENSNTEKNIKQSLEANSGGDTDTNVQSLTKNLTGKEATIAKLKEQKSNLNLWERMSGVGGEINEQIYRLETGKEMNQNWKESYERKVNEGKVGTVLGGFEDRGPKVEPTTKLIDSQSYSSSTNKTISMFDMLTSGDRSQIEEALYMQRSKERGVGEGYSDWVGNPEYEKDTLKWLNNAKIDKSNKTSVKGSSGIESVASSKTPKINLLPITGDGQSKVASSSGATGNESVVFSSEDPSQTNFAVQGIYNVSQA